jgi:hypothetical protein
MSDADDRKRFTNVEMPQWYRITALVVRAVGFFTLLAAAWQATHQDISPSPWPMAGVIVGVLLLVLPSLPKAYIEQRNRFRGLRDGSFKKFVENDKRRDG